MYRNILSLLVTLVLALPSSAGVIITSSGVPTVGLPAFTTYTLKASTDDGSHIVGFDFASQRSYGIYGPMNQVNPFGLPTVFSDNNAAVGAVAHVSQDSQFLFNTANVTVPAGFASESNSTLRAVFAAGSSLGTTNVPFVQVVVPDAGGIIHFFGTVTVHGGSDFLDVPVTNGCFDCFPPTIQDGFIDNVDANLPGFVGHTLGFTSFGSLSNFRFDSYVPTGGGAGTGPAVPATFDYSTRQFHWNTVGSPLGTYKWLVTATNPYGTDEGSITVRITVPEPVTVTLMGLGLAGYLATTRPRRWHNRKCDEN